MSEKMESPKILLFDCNSDVKDALNENHYNYESASFGEQVKVVHNKPQNSYVNLSVDFPDNMHEFDIFIVDMKGHSIDLETTETIPTTKNSHVFELEYPKNAFFAAAVSARFIAKKMPLTGIYIIFASEEVKAKYGCYKITAQGLSHTDDSDDHCNHDFIRELSPQYLWYQVKSGYKIKVSDSLFAETLGKHKKGFRYNLTFSHPNNGVVSDDNGFFPLLYNGDDEIVGFIWLHQNKTMLVLPQIEDKANLILNLLSTIADFLPEKFPYLTQFNWISDRSYQLPNELELRKQIEQENIRHDEIINSIESKILDNRTKYSFLHDLLMETSDTLVNAVIKYFEWLEYDKVVDIDKSTGELKEDINVFESNKLLIIEVKGISGTSSDSDCSQIGKHRRRKERENRELEVYALYIVNHQRYLPPHTRENPPFTQDQIDYALNDERGLTTTFQLYKWYYLCEAGIITKDEIKQQLLCHGNIGLLPQTYRLLGKVKEYYGDHNACIFELIDCKVRVSDKLLFLKANEWILSEIVSIKVNDIDVLEVENGEVGVVVKDKVGKGFEVFMLSQ